MQQSKYPGVPGKRMTNHVNLVTTTCFFSVAHVLKVLPRIFMKD